MATGRFCACVQGDGFAPVVLSSAFLNWSSVHVIVQFGCFLIRFKRAFVQHPVVSIPRRSERPVCPEAPGVIRGFIHALESQATAHRLRLQQCRTGMQWLASVTEWRTIRQVNLTTHTLVAYLNINSIFIPKCVCDLYLSETARNPHLCHFGNLSANAYNFALFQKTRSVDQ